MAAIKKNPAAVALGRMGGKKGGPARAAKLTPEQRSASARKAVLARWANVKGADYEKVKGASMKKFSEFTKQVNEATPTVAATDTSDRAFLALLKRFKATHDPSEMRQLSEQIERMIFHKQFENA
jgi:hypothetical protein